MRRSMIFWRDHCAASTDFSRRFSQYAPTATTIGVNAATASFAISRLVHVLAATAAHSTRRSTFPRRAGLSAERSAYEPPSPATGGSVESHATRSSRRVIGTRSMTPAGAPIRAGSRRIAADAEANSRPHLRANGTLLEPWPCAATSSSHEKPRSRRASSHSGGGIRTRDLRVMSSLARDLVR